MMYVNVIRECNDLVKKGEMNFPALVARFVEAGIERYKVDLVRMESVYYWFNGDTHVEKLDYKVNKIPTAFDKKMVQNAIALAQQGKVDYQRFLELITAAGCSHYNAYLDGKRVTYSGRDGESHTENFPQ